MSTASLPAVAPPSPGADRYLPFDGRRVRAYRKRAGLTAPQLLARIHAQPFPLTLSGLTSIERGRTRPRPATAKAIAAALQLDLDQFDPAVIPVDPDTGAPEVTS